MILLPLIVSLFFVLSAFFSGKRLVQLVVTPAYVGMLVAYFFAVKWKPLDMVADQNLDWLMIMNMDIGLGFVVNPANSLLLITLLLVFLFFLPFFLEGSEKANLKKKICLLLSSTFFIMTGILSAGIVTFFISWLMLGIVGFVESGEYLDRDKRRSKFFYIGMDGFLMFFGLLLLSVISSSARFDVINEKFQYIAQEEKGIVLLAFLMLLSAVFIRTSFFPFLFNYRKEMVARSPHVHMFQFLTALPLGHVLIIKLSQAMDVPLFSNIFFILGMITSFVVLLVALTRSKAIEILNLENGAMAGIVYALLGLGQIATSLILLISFLLLKSSINMLFLSISNKDAKRNYFLPMILLTGAYVGVPGLTNFFPFFDVAWVFWGAGASSWFFAFVILSGILYVKLLSIIFDFKDMISSERLWGRLKGRSLVALFPGFVSLLMIFYCIPPNLASANAQILKGKIFSYFGKEPISAGSMQEQNIVMILLFVSVVAGILLGAYIYVIRRKPLPWSIKDRFVWVEQLINYGQVFDKIPQTLLVQKEYVGKHQLLAHVSRQFRAMCGRAEEAIVRFRRISSGSTNVLLMQTFAMMGLCLLAFFLGLGWKNFI